jgi:hypothetical protein
MKKFEVGITLSVFMDAKNAKEALKTVSAWTQEMAKSNPFLVQPTFEVEKVIEEEEESCDDWNTI